MENKPELVTLTHGTTKKQAAIVKSKICGWFKSETQLFTYVLCDGGTVFPVLETEDQIKTIYQGEPNNDK